jgi:hypothetical protein
MIGGLYLLAGCQSLNLNLARIANRPPQASARNPVVEVVCLWEPAEGTGLDKLPARGFAGQILFITSRSEEPVQVDGKVRIYVFDDCGTVEEQQQPIHQFVFDSRSWNAFLRETNLGAAYQLFIPYTRPGNQQAVCSLRVNYESPDGQTIYSKFAKVSLPGSTRPEPDDVASSVRRAAATAQPDSRDPVPAEPDKTVIPAAYTFENTKPSEASIRQLQARFDELLQDRASAAIPHGPSEGQDGAPAARVRLTPAQASPSLTPGDE